MIEVSVFGRGRGEALVLHLGHGAWATVDSFVDPATDEPVALGYLDALGVPRNAVALMVATHWDQDHIGGISTIASAAPDARVFVSSALRSADLVQRIFRHQKRAFASPIGSGTREFVRLHDQLRGNDRRMISACEDKVLWERAGVRLAALAPSQRTSDDALAAPVIAMFDAARTGDAVREPTPNETSVVLSLDASGPAALLGADLEASVSEDVGWKAAGTCELARGLIADLGKVAHHGSSDADEPSVWQRLVTTDALHLLTRYNNGDRSLPSAADCRRLTDRGARGRVVGAPPQRVHLHGIVGKRARAATRNGVWTVTGPVGHVCWRRRIAVEDPAVVSWRGQTTELDAGLAA